MGYHAKLSPSSASRWSTCTASQAQSAGKPNKSSEASRSGTADHLVSSECLEKNLDPSIYLGRTLLFWEHPESDSNGESWSDEVGSADELMICHQIVIDEESVARCLAYVTFVRDLTATTGGVLMVEQRVPISQITGEYGATGTSDTVLIAQKDLIIADAKFGSGRVNAYEVIKPATASTPAILEPNKQLAMYAHGTLTEHGWMAPIERVRMIIVQPRLNHVSEFSMTVEALEAFIQTLRVAAEETRTAPKFLANSDNCFFCPGRIDCPERERVVLEAALGDFTDLDAVTAPAPVSLFSLGQLYDKVALVAKWCSDMQERMVETLLTGTPVVRPDGTAYKLVAGRRGKRKWTNEAEAEQYLSKLRLSVDQIYTRSLISPTAADELAHPKQKRGAPEVKAAIGKTQWTRLAALIEQPDGKPEVALETDGRPALSVSDFDVLVSDAAVPVEPDLFV
jgi:hypothetical protein